MAQCPSSGQKGHGRFRFTWRGKEKLHFTFKTGLKIPSQPPKDGHVCRLGTRTNGVSHSVVSEVVLLRQLLHQRVNLEVVEDVDALHVTEAVVQDSRQLEGQAPGFSEDGGPFKP